MNPMELGCKLIDAYEPPFMLGMPDNTQVSVSLGTIRLIVEVPDADGNNINWNLEDVISEAWLNIPGVEAVEIDHYNACRVYIDIDLDEFGFLDWASLKETVYRTAVNLATMCRLYEASIQQNP